MQDLTVNVAKRLDQIERAVEKMMRVLKSDAKRPNEAEPVRVKAEDEECLHNGVNLLRILTRDAYSDGLQLMDVLFTKEELSGSLLFKSKNKVISPD